MDPLLLAVAAALAARAAEEGAGTAWSKLVRLVRGRSSQEEPVRATLESAQAAPGDMQRVEDLARELSRIADADPGFRDQLTGLWPSAERELRATGTVNRIDGSVSGGVFQAGTANVTGDITFGQ